MDSALAQVEDDRMTTIKDVFQSYAKQLEKIAHLMQPDLQRLLDKESQVRKSDLLASPNTKYVVHVVNISIFSTRLHGLTLILDKDTWESLVPRRCLNIILWWRNNNKTSINEIYYVF